MNLTSLLQALENKASDLSHLEIDWSCTNRIVMGWGSSGNYLVISASNCTQDRKSIAELKNFLVDPKQISFPYDTFREWSALFDLNADLGDSGQLEFDIGFLGRDPNRPAISRLLLYVGNTWSTDIMKSVRRKSRADLL